MICTPLIHLPLDLLLLGKALESKQLLTSHHNNGGGGGRGGTIFFKSTPQVPVEYITLHINLSWPPLFFMYPQLMQPQYPCSWPEILVWSQFFHFSIPALKWSANLLHKFDLVHSSMRQFHDVLCTSSFSTLGGSRTCNPSSLSAWICKTFM